jgi:hypothetical protein
LLTKDKHMIQAVTPDGPDQPLYIGILPGRSRCNWSIPNAHRPQTSGKDWPIGSVIVAHQVRRCRIPRKCLHKLLGQPFSCRIPGDRKPHELPPTDARMLAWAPRIDRSPQWLRHCCTGMSASPARVVHGAGSYIWKPWTDRLRSQA